MYWELKRRTAEGIPVFQQSPLQPDVWEALRGDKDDFLVYDRCGQLTFHIVLPYSYLHHPYVEAAIRATYHRDICNCTVDSNSTLSEEQQNSTTVTTGTSPSQISEEPPADPARPVNGHHHHSQTHGHYHPTHSHPVITKAEDRNIGVSHHHTHDEGQESHAIHKH
uniref:Selenoprotein P N-terminal domain-containing protein n=1 Tax=Astyanax mexicanus TaxID=7994 RepID=A0A3B1J765_ASTMX